MEFIEIPLAGAYLIEPRKDRGSPRVLRAELVPGGVLRARPDEEHGADERRVQHEAGARSAGCTTRSVPTQEAKLIRCTRGAIYDVIVDLRPDSPTRGKWYGAELTADNGLMLYAPEGFAHGYQTLSDDAEMFYMTSAFYAAGAARGVRHDDPALSIRWPLPVTVISAADQKWPDFVPDGAGSGR